MAARTLLAAGVGLEPVELGEELVDCPVAAVV